MDSEVDFSSKLTNSAARSRAGPTRSIPTTKNALTNAPEARDVDTNICNLNPNNFLDAGTLNEDGNPRLGEQ